MSATDDAIGHDLATLASKLLRPERRRWAEARAVVEGAHGARAAWEGLAARGILPYDWVSGDERWFHFLPRGAARTEAKTTERRVIGEAPRSPAVRVRRWPRTLTETALVASDVAGMTTTEALAREAHARLEPWLGREPTSASEVVWRFVRDERALTDYSRLLVGLGAAVLRLARRLRSDVTAPAPTVLDARSVARVIVQARVVWRELSDSGEAFVDDDERDRDWWGGRWVERSTDPRSVWVPPPAAIFDCRRVLFGPGLAGRRFAAVPNPFEPVYDLWSTGYALTAVTPAVITLCAAGAHGHPGIDEKG